MAPRNLRATPSPGEHNSLWYWTRAKHPARIALNYLLMKLARPMPSLRAKNWLYRRMGMKVGRNVSFGLETTVDIFWPELIEVGENTIVGYGTTLLGHEFLTRELRRGRVVIGKDVVIGANCTILPGVTIADGAVVSAGSLVNRDVEGFVGGVPARPLRSASSAESGE
jgi:acetyltransferase-like isoleucine patch superfamily enzyme